MNLNKVQPVVVLKIHCLVLSSSPKISQTIVFDTIIKLMIIGFPVFYTYKAL